MGFFSFETEVYYECMEEVLESQCAVRFQYNPPIPAQSKEQQELVERVTAAQVSLIDEKLAVDGSRRFRGRHFSARNIT